MSEFFQAISATPLKAGQVVATQFDGTLAICAANVTPVGAVIAAAQMGAATDVQTDGVLKLDDWNIATGFRDLSPGSTYYISNSQSGFLTTIKPTTVGQFITRIGVAVTRRNLLVKLELPFEIQAVGGGGTPPTGTGFRHVTAGAEDAASKLVENADVHASGAIVESKLSLNFPTHSNTLDHSNTNDPSSGEKSALVGTNGTPGTGNKYVTNSDPRNTDSRTPVSHTHPINEVTSLQSSLDGKAATVHTHSISDVTSLQSSLDGKAATVHTHVIGDTTGLQVALDGKAALVHTHAGLPVMKRVPTADATNNSNVTFVNLFTQAILAGEVWSFDGIIYWFSAAGTTGLVTQVDAPASPTFSQCLMATAESATAYRNLPAAAGAVMTGTASATAAIIPAYISGTIENGANAGNIVIKFRSEVNTSLVTVKRGSWCRFYKH